MKWSKETIEAVSGRVQSYYDVYDRDPPLPRHVEGIAKEALSAIEQSAEVKALVDAAHDMLAERDRMVVSGAYNDLAGVSHGLRVALKPFTEASDGK